MATKQSINTPRYRGSELIRTAAGATRDVLSVILAPEELYTADEVAHKIQAFMSKEAQ